MYHFSKKSLEKLYHPKFHNDLRHLMLEAIKDSPLDFTVIETIRTVAQQKVNVAKGASKTMKSKHIPSSNASGYCEAVDIAPYPINWQNTKRFDILAEHILKKAKELKINIVWGGTWKNLVDKPHYELK